jgi:hypothetical protein
MSIDELVQILTNELTDLINRQQLALQLGDVDAYTELEQKIADTKVSLNKLKS